MKISCVSKINSITIFIEIIKEKKLKNKCLSVRMNNSSESDIELFSKREEFHKTLATIIISNMDK